MRRHRHNLNHYRLVACDMGQLVPVSCVEVLMGDTFRHASSALIRFSPLATPVMHPVHAKIHHWFVPHRLVWPDFEQFITGADDTLSPPQVTVPDPGGDLLDHLGVDPAANGLQVNSLPVRAYNLIWNEIYRDQDLDAEVALDSLVLQRARWEKDYFTVARTTPQQGPDISIPFEAGGAPVTGIGFGTGYVSNLNNAAARETDGSSTVTYVDGSSSSGTQIFVEEDPNNAGYPNVRVDLSQATGSISVRDLWLSEALQRFAEYRSRYGERYTDYARFHGVTPSDARLQRPEYLGGGKQTISFSEVLATAESTGVPVGALKGHGISAVRTRPYRRFFSEHGYVISLMSLRPRAVYEQSVNKTFLRRTKEDFWQRELENIGQEPVLAQELYASEADPEAVFGWNDRYQSYRQQPSFVSGAFRTSPYDNWHLARGFGSTPSLNASFVECTPPNRIFADTNDPELLVMMQHMITAQRLVTRSPR